jgi:hypothetical protein
MQPASNLDAAIRFHQIDTILFAGHRDDASYHSEASSTQILARKYRRRASRQPTHPTNGAVHIIESRIMKKNIMVPASEAETGALFHNGQEIAHMHQILKELDYQQPGPTRLTTDNSTADGFANKPTKIKRSKA